MTSTGERGMRMHSSLSEVNETGFKNPVNTLINVAKAFTSGRGGSSPPPQA